MGAGRTDGQGYGSGRVRVKPVTRGAPRSAGCSDLLGLSVRFACRTLCSPSGTKRAAPSVAAPSALSSPGCRRPAGPRPPSRLRPRRRKRTSTVGVSASASSSADVAAAGSTSVTCSTTAAGVTGSLGAVRSPRPSARTTRAGRPLPDSCLPAAESTGSWWMITPRPLQISHGSLNAPRAGRFRFACASSGPARARG